MPNNTADDYRIVKARTAAGDQEHGQPAGDQSPTRPALTARTPMRASRIQVIRDLADWFEAHPEVPAPTSISMTWRHTAVDEADEATRVAAVAAVAGHLGEEMYPRGVEVPHQFDYWIDSQFSGAPCDVQYIGVAQLPFDRDL